MADNRLNASTSPYLLQHQHNPVDWRPWGSEALTEAKTLDKPILLSVGYAACHWCHVMAHESFEDQQTADVMNRLFVNIKVDREERPDIDQIYMNALHALGEQGGWPLTMFLTPEGQPFWGGTYFPKDARWGRPSFIDVLNAVHQTYATDRNRIDINRNALMEALAGQAAQPGQVDEDLLTQAANRLLGMIDQKNGGIQGAPKFPQAAVLEFLWRHAIRTGTESFRQAFLQTLKRISLGGIYDQIGGGLCRYSTDDRWLVPHFEKMLYDNGQYLNQLVWAYGTTGDELFRTRIEETAEWLLREMQTRKGGFASSFDADLEGEEGKFYVWTPDEIIDLLGHEAGTAFNDLFDITPTGNYEGRNIPNLLNAINPQAALTPSIRQQLESLRLEREKRVPPAQDDKILADWNGIAIAALAYAGHNVSRESWRNGAIKAYRFIMDHMRDSEGRLAHAWREGSFTRPAFASDYAWMMKAALALADTEHSYDRKTRYLGDAAALGDVLESDYVHPDGGYYLTSKMADDLIIRPVSSQDDAIANYNSVAASAYIRLWHMTGDDKYRDIADRILSAFSGAVPRNIFGSAALMSAYDDRWHSRIAVVLAPPGTDPKPVLSAISAIADPAIICNVHESSEGLPRYHPASGKVALDGVATLYLCREGLCSAPLTDIEDIKNYLTDRR